MSEATPQKRVLPARERSDSSKKRVTSPAIPTTPATAEPRQKRKYTKRASLIKPPTPLTGTPTPSNGGEDALPTRLHSSIHLPTSSQKQPEKLSNKDYQSIAESAVLAASLHRSRMQWLCDGIFTRYWTKPVKRKGVIEQPPGNPDAKSMSKLGNATMTIEPHVFDVTFYTVKDTSSILPPIYRHPNQHTAKPAAAPPPAALPVLNPQPLLQPPAQQPTKPVQPTQPPINSPIVAASSSTAPAVAATTPVKEEIPITQLKTELQGSSTPPVSLPSHPVAHPPTQSVAPAPQENGITKPPNDPVIQMLAARAATDNKLKELMKVVALSKASVEQLREFQAHIDEFKKVIEQQGANKPASSKPKQSPAPSAAHPATYSTPSRPHPGPPSSMGGPMHMAPPSYVAYPPPRAEPFIKHIVIEFHSAASVSQGASTDRWLFPEHAILDIRSGGMEMVASFFVVRKGNEILKRLGADSDDNGSGLGQKFKTGEDYYQPITMFIKATQHKTIETIARAAKPLPDCQRHMKEVMEQKTRASDEYLVYRLPREKSLAETNPSEFVDSAVELSNGEDDELKDVYTL